ncbi:MAG: hypothetical protein QM740_17935 [Acidovorax sp.]
MSAIAAPTRPKAVAKPIKKAAQQNQPPHPATDAPPKQPAKLSPLLEEVDNQLYDAYKALEHTLLADDSSESGLLLMVAIEILDNLKIALAVDDPPGFKIILQQCMALIKAARRAPGYKDVPKQSAGLNEAEAILNTLAGPQVAIDKPTATGTAVTQSRDTFASTAYCRAGEAEAVIRAHAEASGHEHARAVLTIVEVATGILSRIHEAPGATDCQTASNLLSQAIAVGSLVTDDEPDLLLDAGLTILVLAKDILDKGREELPHA